MAKVDKLIFISLHIVLGSGGCPFSHEVSSMRS